MAAPTLPQIDFPEIQLTAGLVQDTAANLTSLVDTFGAVPFPLLQQLISNQVGYVGDVLTGNIGGVFEGIGGNLLDAIKSPFSLVNPTTGLSGLLTGADLLGANEGLFTIAYNLGLIDSDLLGLMASPFSGLLLGAIGPVAGPGIVLADGLSAIFDGGLNTSALSGLIDIPGNMLNAFLNGGEFLNLTGLLTPLLPAGLIPDGTGLGFEMGGLLSGPGSLFGALEAQLAGNPFLLDGTGVGPIAALLELPRALTMSIGWDGVGDPFVGPGLLSTIAGSFGLPEVVNGLGDIQSFLTGILDPLTAALAFLPEQLNNLLAEVLGTGLSIDTLSQAMLNIPALLLTMLL